MRRLLESYLHGFVAMKRWLISIAIVLVVAALGLAIFARYVRSHAMQVLRERYGDRVEVANLNVSLFPRIAVTCGPIVVRQDHPRPLIEIDRLSAHTGWISAIAGRVARVRIEGMKITIPPRGERASLEKPKSDKSSYVHVTEVVADGTVLKILPKDSEKPPLEFDIHQLVLHNAGVGRAMTFDASLTNAKPPGEISSRGSFGPWNSDEPAATPVSGQYTFRNADLGVFKGISGKLSSDGKYEGVLDRIEAQGHTETPDFALRVAGNPMHLATDYQATIDGTNGDVYLHPVHGMLERTPIETSGVIERLPGTHGRIISLDGSVTRGRLEDVLRLSVRSKEAPMSGTISFKSKIIIPPGDEDVVEKLQLDGGFLIDQAHFSKLSVQEKVNDLSNRGRGEPEAPNSATVASNFRGRFKLDKGIITFSHLGFDVPGITIALDGTYGLLDEKIDLRGTARLQAKLSDTTTGFKSVMLKAIDGLFSRKHEGAVIPIKIGGTADSPSFGLSLKPHG